MSSKVISMINTPTKQSLLTHGQSISPIKKGSKIFSSTNLSSSSSRYKPDATESVESSLIAKMIETQVSNEQQYQNLLIHNKEMEIKLLALEQQAQSLRKDFKKANKPIEQMKTKIQNGRFSLIEKQKYLEKFYLHLDSKLKSNVHSKLFARLDKIQQTLQRKYEQQKQQLYQSLASQHSKIQIANQELHRLSEYRDQLLKSYTERAIQISSQRNFSEEQLISEREPSQRKSHNKSQNNSEYKRKSSQLFSKSSAQNKQKKVDKKQQKKQAKEQNQKQCEYLKASIQKLNKEKEIAEKDEKLLKILLNIDEEHKKYSAYILNGYKKVFAIRYRGILSKRKRNSIKTSKISLKRSSLVSLPNVQGLQSELKKRVTERDLLKSQVQERIIGLSKCKQKLNEQIGEYSQLQNRIMKLSNKNSKEMKNNQAEIYNYRSTYTENQSVQNHRSTYTSYKKHSEGDDHDL